MAFEASKMSTTASTMANNPAMRLYVRFLISCLVSSWYIG